MIKTVKKFSKKSLSLLIALIMVFSAMPFTPPISVEAANADETPSVTAELVKTNIGNVKKSYSFVTDYNAGTDYMKGIIRAGTWTNSTNLTIQYNSSNADNKIDMKVVGASNIVGLYKGNESDIRFPLVAQYTFNDDQLAVKNYIGYDHISLSTSGTNFGMGVSTWKSCSDWNNLTDVTDSAFTNYDFSSDIKNDVGRTTSGKNYTSNRFKTTDKDKRYWKNSLKYNGNFSNGSYYDKIQSPSFELQADYSWSYFKPFAGTQYEYSTNRKDTLSTSLNFYVLNIEPLLNIINSSDFESHFNTIYNNLWMYDSTKREAYFTAMNNIISFNLDNESLTNESDVITVANKIKKLVDDYDKTKNVPIKTITVSFNMGDGSIITKSIKAGQKVGVVTLPTNTSKTKIQGEDKHNVFSWQDGISDILPHYEEDAIFYEIATPEACTGGTATCTDAPICEECKSSYSTPLGHDYGSATKIETTDDENHTLQKHQKTCSRCKDVLVENHNLTITGTTASCSDCDYSVSSDYKSNGFRITKGNLFDVDAYAATDSATINPNSGAVSVDTVNDTITVAGLKYDAYTNYAAKGNYYRLPVSRLSYYTISYTPSSDNNQVFCFFSDGESGDYKYNEKYNDSKYGAPANQEYKLTFQALESYVDFRFGTVESGGICTFSNISFYESDANGNPVNGYKVLASNIPNDANVLNSLNIPSADKCNASYSMTGKTGKISSTDTIATNLNITLDTEHNYSGTYTPTYSAGNSYNDTEDYYTHSRTCTDCGYVDTQTCTFVNQGVIGDNATVTCSVCGGTYTLSYEAYNAELKVLDGMLAETNKYSNTEACKSERNSVNDSAVSSDIRTQPEIDAKVEALKEIENKLTLQQYTITFNVATVDGKTLATNITGTGTYDYGTMVELDLPEQYQTNYVVTTWKRYAKGEDKVVGATSTKLYVVVNQESTYTAVINSVATGTVGENQAVLTLNNKSGKTVDVGIVDTNQEQNVTVNIADSKIKIGSVELTAPTYSFYTLKGFYIDKTLYSESGGTVTITKDTVITPYYDASLFVNIKRASDESFTINNENIDLYPANWNQKVTLKSETEVYWYNDNDVLLGKGTTYSFYANSNVTIHTKAVGSVENVAPTTSIGYFDYDSTLNKVTVVNNFFVPDGKTVTEAGVILSTKNSTVDALKKQTNGIFKGGPESFTSTGNQIRISVSRTANTPFTMYALAYVVVDGTTYYANEVKSINYTPKSA